jgi:hypothetical protein
MHTVLFLKHITLSIGIKFIQRVHYDHGFKKL